MASAFSVLVGNFMLGLADRISFLGHREDIPELMAAADLLVHPARHDTTGTVILEAVVNGLPVITTSTCGYAHHVEAARPAANRLRQGGFYWIDHRF